LGFGDFKVRLLPCALCPALPALHCPHLAARGVGFAVRAFEPPRYPERSGDALLLDAVQGKLASLVASRPWTASALQRVAQ
jgi:hypothetical protein